MQISSKEAPASRRWLLNLYLILAGLIQTGILLQGFFIGVLLFAGMSWGQSLHGSTGLVLLLLALLLAVVGLLAPISGNLKILSWVFFILVIVQILLASFSESIPLVAALHPANAMILFGMNIFLILRVRQILSRKNLA